jgi:hypothetical protein
VERAGRVPARSSITVMRRGVTFLTTTQGLTGRGWTVRVRY